MYMPHNAASSTYPLPAWDCQAQSVCEGPRHLGVVGAQFKVLPNALGTRVAVIFEGFQGVLNRAPAVMRTVGLSENRWKSCSA